MKADAEGSRKSLEYPKGSGILMREIINTHSGTTYSSSHRVTIPTKLTGKRRQIRQFKDTKKAKKWANEVYDAARKQGTDYFHATDDERRQFVEILPDLRKAKLSLKEIVDFAIPRLRPEGGSKTVAELIDEMIKSKQARLKSGQLRPRSERDFRNRTTKFSEFFGDSLVREVTKDDIKAWIESLELSPRSNKNYKDVVSEILKHAFQSRLILENPLDFLTDLERKELFSESDQNKQPAILSVEDSQCLIQGAHERTDLGLLPVIALGLFCGLRTSEIQRLDWKDIHLESDRPFVSIGADIAKKRSIRNVDIVQNAAEWLSLCQRQSGEVIPNPYMAYLYRRLHKLLAHVGLGKKDEAGVVQTNWGNNLMRHSYATYHYAFRGNANETTRQLGHDGGLQMLFKHYRALATKKDGERYFNIKPAASAAKVVEFAE